MSKKYFAGLSNITTSIIKLCGTASSALLFYAATGCYDVCRLNGISKEYWSKRFFKDDSKTCKTQT